MLLLLLLFLYLYFLLLLLLLLGLFCFLEEKYIWCSKSGGVSAVVVGVELVLELFSSYWSAARAHSDDTEKVSNQPSPGEEPSGTLVIGVT